MKKNIQNLYLSLPVSVQNILVSIYGIGIYRQRYGFGSRKFDKCLNVSQYYSQEQMRDYQDKKFLYIAKLSIRYVPFYRDWAKRNNVELDDFKSIKDLKYFPVIEKKQIQESPGSFISDRHRDRKLIELSTSGSTGTPLKIYCDQKTRTFHYAFFTRVRSWYGINKRSKRATFLGRVVVSGKQKTPPYWRYDAVQKNLIMSSYHLSEENMEFYYRELNKFKPEEIFGYASSIYFLALYIMRQNLNPIQLKIVMTTAETLMPYQREVIEKAFNCVVVDQYGCTEMAFFASQCKSGSMLFHPEHSVIEVRDHGSGIIRNTGSGELVATSLINEAMPLIRYRVGDSVLISEMNDVLYPSFPKITELEGRTDDLIYTKDGRKIGRLSPIFRSDKNIKSSQVVQKIDGSVDIYVVPDQGYTTTHRELILSEAAERIGCSLSINVFEVDCLKKENNGKFRPVKSFYKPGLSGSS
ncbi:hypothetical protein [Marinobacter sp.]|uniref:phenylacetate--CoA ligase family protein n=1 Tax=Marinobacter sp. TaxID=50741 RepID=UPI002B264FFA|nr:hypothetical protein [Marinobacter sp.]